MLVGQIVATIEAMKIKRIIAVAGALAALTITGVGYTAQSNDQNLWMALGLVTWTGAPSRG